MRMLRKEIRVIRIHSWFRIILFFYEYTFHNHRLNHPLRFYFR